MVRSFKHFVRPGVVRQNGSRHPALDSFIFGSFVVSYKSHQFYVIVCLLLLFSSKEGVYFIQCKVESNLRFSLPES